MIVLYSLKYSNIFTYIFIYVYYNLASSTKEYVEFILRRTSINWNISTWFIFCGTLKAFALQSMQRQF